MEPAHGPAASRGQPMHRPGVTVAARLRPLSQIERDKGVSVPWRVDSVGSRLQLAGGGSAAPGALPRFDFDHVYDSDTTQHAIYEDLGRPLVQHAFAGGTAVLFAHGASGSGKTHALTGETLNPGIATRLFCEVFDTLQEAPHGCRGSISVSFAEVHRDRVLDLLVATDKTGSRRSSHGGMGKAGGTGSWVRTTRGSHESIDRGRRRRHSHEISDARTGAQTSMDSSGPASTGSSPHARSATHVASLSNVSEVLVSSPEEMCKYKEEGEEARSPGAHRLGCCSASVSHTVLSIHIRHPPHAPTGAQGTTSGDRMLLSSFDEGDVVSESDEASCDKQAAHGIIHIVDLASSNAAACLSTHLAACEHLTDGAGLGGMQNNATSSLSLLGQETWWPPEFHRSRCRGGAAMLGAVAGVDQSLSSLGTALAHAAALWPSCALEEKHAKQRGGCDGHGRDANGLNVSPEALRHLPDSLLSRLPGVLCRAWGQVKCVVLICISGAEAAVDDSLAALRFGAGIHDAQTRALCASRLTHTRALLASPTPVCITLGGHSPCAAPCEHDLEGAADTGRSGGRGGGGERGACGRDVGVTFRRALQRLRLARCEGNTGEVKFEAIAHLTAVVERQRQVVRSEWERRERAQGSAGALAGAGAVELKKEAALWHGQLGRAALSQVVEESLRPWLSHSCTLVTEVQQVEVELADSRLALTKAFAVATTSLSSLLAFFHAPDSPPPLDSQACEDAAAAAQGRDYPAGSRERGQSRHAAGKEEAGRAAQGASASTGRGGVGGWGERDVEHAAGKRCGGAGVCLSAEQETTRKLEAGLKRAGELVASVSALSCLRRRAQESANKLHELLTSILDQVVVTALDREHIHRAPATQPAGRGAGGRLCLEGALRAFDDVEYMRAWVGSVRVRVNEGYTLDVEPWQVEALERGLSRLLAGKVDAESLPPCDAVAGVTAGVAGADDAKGREREGSAAWAMARYGKGGEVLAIECMVRWAAEELRRRQKLREEQAAHVRMTAELAGQGEREALWERCHDERRVREEAVEVACRLNKELAETVGLHEEVVRALQRLLERDARRYSLEQRALSEERSCFALQAEEWASDKAALEALVADREAELLDVRCQLLDAQAVTSAVMPSGGPQIISWQERKRAVAAGDAGVDGGPEVAKEQQGHAEAGVKHTDAEAAPVDGAGAGRRRSDGVQVRGQGGGGERVDGDVDVFQKLLEAAGDVSVHYLQRMAGDGEEEEAAGGERGALALRELLAGIEAATTEAEAMRDELAGLRRERGRAYCGSAAAGDLAMQVLAAQAATEKERARRRALQRVLPDPSLAKAGRPDRQETKANTIRQDPAPDLDPPAETAAEVERLRRLVARLSEAELTWRVRLGVLACERDEAEAAKQRLWHHLSCVRHLNPFPAKTGELDVSDRRSRNGHQRACQTPRPSPAKAKKGKGLASTALPRMSKAASEPPMACQQADLTVTLSTTVTTAPGQRAASCSPMTLHRGSPGQSRGRGGAAGLPQRLCMHACNVI